MGLTMCDPITQAATQLAIQGANIAGTRSAAKSQFLANATLREQQNEEIAAQANARAGERVKQSRAERARLRVAGGEAGIAGNSFEALLLDSVFQEDQDIATIGLDARFQDRASETRFLSANSRVNNPGVLENGLQIAGAGVQGFAQGKAFQSRIPSSETIDRLSIPIAGDNFNPARTQGLA